MARLKRIVLPEDSKFLRRLPASKLDDPDFVKAFDQHTLFYDTFYDAETGLITLVGPSLKTQRRFFRGAHFKVDGTPIPDFTLDLVSPRTSQVSFPSPNDDPKNLRLFHRVQPVLNAQVLIGRAQHDKFAGKNALVAISKNNNLAWIQDWLSYYVTEHGANAVVLIDNGSTDYDLRALRQCIIGVKGLEAAEIVSAPFPFGPKAVDRISTNSKFFHLSVLHIAHKRFLARANAVLSVDIDELVTKAGGQSVFEAVKATPRGFMSIPGTWRYARRPATSDAVIRHADHVLRRKGRDGTMQPKWCLDPSGLAGGKYWRVHGILGERRYHDHDYRYLHCRQITTNWDYDRDYEDENDFEEAPEADAIRQAFSEFA